MAEVDCEPVRLAQISRFVENSYIHNFYWSYTELNKVLNHPISHIHVGAGIEAVAFVFEYTSYRQCRCLNKYKNILQYKYNTVDYIIFVTHHTVLG